MQSITVAHRQTLLLTPLDSAVLKMTHLLLREVNWVGTTMLATRLCLSPSTITRQAQRLSTAGLVDYQKYHGFRLTPPGCSFVQRLLWRCRLLERYLIEDLGYSALEGQHEAERLEYTVSDRFIEALSHHLQFPSSAQSD